MKISTLASVATATITKNPIYMTWYSLSYIDFFLENNDHEFPKLRLRIRSLNSTFLVFEIHVHFFNTFTIHQLNKQKQTCFSVEISGTS